MNLKVFLVFLCNLGVNLCLELEPVGILQLDYVQLPTFYYCTVTDSLQHNTQAAPSHWVD